MVSLGNIDPIAPALSAGPAAKPKEAAPPAPTAAPPPADAVQKDAAFDEQMLDRIAQRLIKRDPGLAIERDDVVRRYIYRFFDSEDGKLVRQFPVEKVLATMRALHLASEGRATAAADFEA